MKKARIVQTAVGPRVLPDGIPAWIDAPADDPVVMRMKPGERKAGMVRIPNPALREFFRTGRLPG